MKWGKKKKDMKQNEEKTKTKIMDQAAQEPKPKQQQQHQFSLSRMLPLSSWFTKLKRPNISPPRPPPSNPPPLESSFKPSLRPSFVPIDRVVVDEPRRLSVGNDSATLARTRASISRSARHNSLNEHELRRLLQRSLNTDSEKIIDGHAKPRILPADRETTPRSGRSLPRRQTTVRADQDLPILLKPIHINRDHHHHQHSSRKSFEFSMRYKNKPKVRRAVYSPRSLSALRTRTRPTILSEEQGEEKLEKFAVLKKTRDPQREFRESMAEMVIEKGMVGRPEEMERLLAAYLLLNSDEHHDVIVKAFRQLWFDLARRRQESVTWDHRCSRRFG